MSEQKNILLAFYGDDLTGSTDALEFICRAGAKAVLFLEPPIPEQLSKHSDLNAYGIAGLTRSLSPQAMEKELMPAFTLMKETAARHVHYKVCSTFDSSPKIGSIGKAIDCGAEIFQDEFVPVLGGMPALGRYCMFGNLFAKMGTAGNGNIYRIDRHPSMSKHPVTPANESDLRLHLGSQTKKKFGLIDITRIEKSIEHWNEQIQDDDEVVLLDVMSEDQLLKIGEWLDNQYYGKTLFSVGSSGIEMSLGNYWNKTGKLQAVKSWPAIESVHPLLVVSGSCSPVTAKQIAYAKNNGFEEVVLDAIKLCEDNTIVEGVLKNLVHLLEKKKDVIVHTGEKNGENLSSEVLGKLLGVIAREGVEKGNVKRVVIAGGDTSSYAARAMGIEALKMIAPLVLGAPLCKAYSTNKAIDGIEVNLKGGQVGGEDYFVILKNGSVSAQ
ncbi:MAG TPA: four-carbon acid sugar kinase family protein [Flavisolibacter sp.]|nr:four-carbon acid sugar kinase family protein [Flavisolibacter sp.]